MAFAEVEAVAVDFTTPLFGSQTAVAVDDDARLRHMPCFEFGFLSTLGSLDPLAFRRLPERVEIAAPLIPRTATILRCPRTGAAEPVVVETRSQATAGGTSTSNARRYRCTASPSAHRARRPRARRGLARRAGRTPPPNDRGNADGLRCGRARAAPGTRPPRECRSSQRRTARVPHPRRREWHAVLCCVARISGVPDGPLPAPSPARRAIVLHQRTTTPARVIK